MTLQFKTSVAKVRLSMATAFGFGVAPQVVNANLPLWAADPPSVSPSAAKSEAAKLDLMWSDLGGGDEARITKATLAFSSTPNETVAFFKTKLKPVQIDRAKIKKWISDLIGNNAELRGIAETELGYLAPLISQELGDASEYAPNEEARNRIQKLVMDAWDHSPSPAAIPAPPPTQEVAAPPAPARTGGPEKKPILLDRVAMPNVRDSRFQSCQSWRRALRAIALLEHFGSPDAVAILRAIAEGEIEAAPTQAALDALIRLGKVAPSPEIPKIRAAFEAYRAACAKRDKRAQLACLTDDRRDDEVLGAFMLAAIRESPRTQAVLKKFNFDAGTVEAEYLKRFKAKHGKDPDTLVEEYTAKVNKAVAEYEKKTGRDSSTIPGPLLSQQVGPAPRQDEELMRAVVLKQIKDRVAFVVEMYAAAPGHEGMADRIGELKNVLARGDVAIGQATVTWVVSSQRGNEPMQRTPYDSVNVVRFRKVAGGWLIETPW